MHISLKNTIIKAGAVMSIMAIFNICVPCVFAYEKHEITPEIMVSLTNASRRENGVVELSLNENLSSAAEAKAGDMFEYQYFDHESPVGKTPWEFIRSAGYEYAFAGENLAMDFVSAEGVHKALMESSSHRENILNVNYSDVGIAVRRGMFKGAETIIVVEEFGSPSKKAAAREVTKMEVQVEVNNPIFQEIKTDQGQKTTQVAEQNKINADSAMPENINNSCKDASIEAGEGKDIELDNNPLVYLSYGQDLVLANWMVCSADFESEKGDFRNGNVAGITEEQGGATQDAGLLYGKYLAIIDSFEKEIMLILLSFAVSMNLYYVSSENGRE